MSVLQIRLKNCLQTILELEPAIGDQGAEFFAREFNSIKAYLEKIDKMQLAEEEVTRLEQVTTRVLNELGAFSSTPITPRILH